MSDELTLSETFNSLDRNECTCNRDIVCKYCGDWIAFDQKLKRVQDELDYLTWFKCNADFGPADSDVHYMLDEEYVQETGKEIPKGWGAGD